MSVYLLGGVVGGEREGVEGVVDTGSVESRGSF